MTNSSLHDQYGALLKVHSDFADGVISSVEHSRQREKALGAALGLVAESCGVTLRTPLAINSNGEFDIQTMPVDGVYPGFGVRFAELLTRYGPRCGTAPGATLAAENAWCFLNHFSAERLVCNHCEHLFADVDSNCSDGLTGDMSPK